MDSEVLPLQEGQQSGPPPQAYAKLQGEFFVYYIRTLSVTLGRHTDGHDDVDVGLGKSKSISRIHARIEFDFVNRIFQLLPIGKNGVNLNGVFCPPGSGPHPLQTQTVIQIGDVIFFFLLPIGSVSRSVRPLISAPTLHLDSFYSRPASPSDTVTRPNSQANSRVNSRANSPVVEDPGFMASHLLRELQHASQPRSSPSSGQGEDDSDQFDPAEDDPDFAPNHKPTVKAQPKKKTVRKANSSNSFSEFSSPTSRTSLSNTRQDLEDGFQGTSSPLKKRGSKSEEDESTPTHATAFSIEPTSLDGPWNSDASVKPPFSYATLIAQAINSTEEKKITLAGIYQFICANYPFYQTTEQTAWQNSIRHNLSLNRSFCKIARQAHEPGKGMFWGINADSVHLFTGTGFKRRARGTVTPKVKTPSKTSSSSSSRRRTPYELSDRRRASMEGSSHEIGQGQDGDEDEEDVEQDLEDGAFLDGDLDPEEETEMS